MSEMKKTLAAATAIAIALGFAPVAFAQDTAAPAAPAADATATPAAPAADAAATPAAPAADAAAAPAAAAPAAAPEGPGTTYVAKSFDAWELECLRTEDGKDPCQIVQMLKDGAGNKVASISILALPAAKDAVAGATIATPLETMLTDGVTLKVDSAEAHTIPFKFCDQLGCYANFAMSKADLDALKKGNKIAMTVVPAAAPDKKVDLEISLKGFTAAFTEAEASMPKQ